MKHVLAKKTWRLGPVECDDGVGVIEDQNFTCVVGVELRDCEAGFDQLMHVIDHSLRASGGVGNEHAAGPYFASGTPFASAPEVVDGGIEILRGAGRVGID